MEIPQHKFTRLLASGVEELQAECAVAMSEVEMRIEQVGSPEMTFHMSSFGESF